MRRTQMSLAGACRVLFLFSVTSAVIWTLRVPTGLSAQVTTHVDFGRDIQPLFEQSCISCHGPAQQSGGLRLDQRSSVRRVPGRLQPGSSATSRIYLRLIGSDVGPQMPLTGALSADQIALIRDWIDQGAAWPDELAGDDPAPQPADPTATRMMGALRTGDYQSFARILDEHPEAVNRKTVGGSTPLMYAALYGDAKAVRLLLDRGADPNRANEAGATALMWAVSDEDITRFLLDDGADPNATSAQGRTPLTVAASRFGSSRVVRLLLDYGAAPTRAISPSPGREQAGSRPGAELVQAANAGDEAVFRMLVDHGADLKAAGALALMLGARANCGTCIDMVIGSLSQPDLNYVLVALAPFGDTPLFTRLIDRGADVNARVSIPDLPVYIAKALKAHSKAWEFFRELAPTYRRDFVVWIHTASFASRSACSRPERS